MIMVYDTTLPAETRKAVRRNLQGAFGKRRRGYLYGVQFLYLADRGILSCREDLDKQRRIGTRRCVSSTRKMIDGM